MMCCLFRLSVPTAAAAGIYAVDKEMVGLAGRTSLNVIFQKWAISIRYHRSLGMEICLRAQFRHRNQPKQDPLSSSINARIAVLLDRKQTKRIDPKKMVNKKKERGERKKEKRDRKKMLQIQPNQS